MTAREICQMAAKGNADVERFCLSWMAFCHQIDDCADKDKPVLDDALAATFATYTLELAGNPWFQTYKGQLIGLMVQSANAWVDSNRENNPIVRDVLKGFWHEVIFHCAFIVGGWKHLRHVTSETREYDFEKEGA